MPWRSMVEWMHKAILSWPQHQLEVSGQIHIPATLPPGKESPVPTRQDAGEVKILDPNMTQILTPQSSSP
jgi:hypothetical protein